MGEPTPENAFRGGEVTRLLKAAAGGDREALDRVLPLVYDELRRIARRQMGRERPGHTLHPTALVHEAYLKLAGSLDAAVADRAHFLAIAARGMREILVDAARRRQARKRGGEWKRTLLATDALAADAPGVEILALDAALDRLEGVDPRLRQVVELRFFGGLTEEEVGGVLGLTSRTVRRDWVRARAWLYRELYTGEAGGD